MVYAVSCLIVTVMNKVLSTGTVVSRSTQPSILIGTLKSVSGLGRVK